MKGKSPALGPATRPFFRSLIGGSSEAKGSELLIVLPFLTLPVYIAQSALLQRAGMLLLKKEECVSCRDIEEKREQV